MCLQISPYYANFPNTTQRAVFGDIPTVHAGARNECTMQKLQSILGMKPPHVPFDNLITKQIAVNMQSEDKDKGADHLAHGHEHHHALLCPCRTFGA